MPDAGAAVTLGGVVEQFRRRSGTVNATHRDAALLLDLGATLGDLANLLGWNAADANHRDSGTAPRRSAATPPAG